MERALVVLVLSLVVFLLLTRARRWAADRVVMQLMTTGGLGMYGYLIKAADMGMLLSVIAFVAAFGKLVLLFLG